MEKIPMTAAGFKGLEDELNQLKNVDRHEIIKAIAEARAHGDLSENAEYHAAKSVRLHRRPGDGLEDQIGRAIAVGFLFCRGLASKTTVAVTRLPTRNAGSRSWAMDPTPKKEHRCGQSPAPWSAR
jgi:transcription elongation factor GreA